ncbi:uncharacterized protein LOC118505887 isoform X2 [Anopheles stephensi]|uniref:uncharacterized protein LOC118505887 isoform X2 n=1 Tax=Anopheles stephensi TaxID=30069 RepID=UPI0016588F25|nr:uncharacterized protein LOC118505887 isoform X2 [Anopheles stephensi]
MTGEIVTFAIGMIVCVPFSGDELSDETPKLPNMSASTSNEGKRKPMSHRLSPISAQVGVSTETATIYGAGMSRCHKTQVFGPKKSAFSIINTALRPPLLPETIESSGWKNRFRSVFAFPTGPNA